MPDNTFWPKKSPFHLFIFLVVFLLTVLSFLCQPCFAIRLGSDSLETGIESPEAFPLEDMLQSLQSDPKAAVLALAEARFRQGLWQEATRYASRVLAMDPNNLKAHGILGAIYALTGQKAKAQKELNFLKDAKDPGFFPDLIEAVLLAQEGKFRMAEKQLDSALQKQPGHPVTTYYSGSLHLAQEKLDPAEESFKTVITSEPDFVPALAGLGQVCLRQKKMKEAAEYYEKAIEKDPEILLYRGQLLEIYRMTGQKDAANKEMKEMLYYTPGVKQSYLTRGMRLLSVGSYREAIALMDKVLGIYKKIPEALYIKAAALVNLKDEKGALKNIESFMSGRWASPQTHHYAGMCYLALDNIAKAEQQFRIVISLSPRSGKSFLPLTLIEQMKGNHDRALEGLRLARSEGEPPPFIHYLTGHILMSTGDKTAYLKEMKGATGLIPGLDPNAQFVVPEEKERARFARERNLIALYFYNGWYGMTIRSCDELLALDKNDRFAWYFKALSEVAQKKTQHAINAFNELLRIEPDLLGAHMSLGRLFMNVGDDGKALSAFKKSIEIDPTFGPAYVALGDLYLAKKKEDAAIQAYEKAIGINPKSPAAYQNLALILSDKPEKLDRALELATRAEGLAPQDPFSIDVLGWVYVQRGETKTGLQKLEEASKRLPQNPVFRYHLGVAYYKNNDFKKAKSALQAAIQLSTDFRGVERAKEILDKISQ